MRKLMLLGLALLGTWAVSYVPPVQADPPVSCIVVLCQPCPEGFRLLQQPNNCCRCVPNPQG